MAYDYNQALAKIAESNRILTTGSGSPESVRDVVTRWADYVNAARAAPSYNDFLEGQRPDLINTVAEQMAASQVGPPPMPESIKGLLGSQTQPNPFGMQPDPNAYSKQLDAARQAALQELQALPTAELAARAGIDPAEYEYYHSAPASEVEQLYGQVQQGAKDYQGGPSLGARLATGIGKAGVMAGLGGLLGGADSILSIPQVLKIGGKALYGALNDDQPDPLDSIGNQLPRALQTAQTAQTGGVPVNVAQDLAGSGLLGNPPPQQTNPLDQPPGDQNVLTNPTGFPSPGDLTAAESGRNVPPVVNGVPSVNVADLGGLLTTATSGTTTDPTQPDDPVGAAMGLLGAKPWGSNMPAPGSPYGPLLWEPAWRAGYLRYR